MAVEACDLGGSIANRSSLAYALAVTLKALIRLGSVSLTSVEQL